ncbi:MAG: hypothetical protein J0L62_01795 [Bacteroidetes bacterium]|nr:hypothetical protein [Bacteroidota bacterium]
MQKYWLLVLFAISGITLSVAQTKLPYKPYIVAGRVSFPFNTSNDDYIVLQETVAGFPTEYDILMYSIKEDLMYNLTDDRKSTFSVSPPNSAVDPTGNWVLFYSFRNKKNGIYLQNLWSKELITITTNADPYFLCSWSPDGQKILYGEESGLINTPNSVVKVFNMDSKATDSYTLTDNEDYTVIRGHSNPAWSVDAKSIFYNTYLKKDGDFIFEFELATNKLRKLVRGSKPRVNPTTGELIYLDNGGLVGFDSKTNSTRNIFSAFKMENDEEGTFDISADGKSVALTAKVGEFPSGYNRQSIFIVDLNTLTYNKIEMKDKSLLNPQYLNEKELVFQIKGLMTAGRDQIFQLENKLFRSDLEGKKVTRMFNWD